LSAGCVVERGAGVQHGVLLLLVTANIGQLQFGMHIWTEGIATLCCLLQFSHEQQHYCTYAPRAVQAIQGVVSIAAGQLCSVFYQSTLLFQMNSAFRIQ
jgi:hypothetical protein